MLTTADTFHQDDPSNPGTVENLCSGRLVLVHKGGNSEVYVPFCGHAVLEEMPDNAIAAPDPLAKVFAARQPNAYLQAAYSPHIGDIITHFALA